MSRGFSLYVMEAELQRFADLERALTLAHDEQRPGWPQLRGMPELWRDFIRANHQPVGRPPPPDARGRPGPPGWPPPLFGRPPPPGPHPIAERLMLLGADGGHVAGSLEVGQLLVKRPIFPLEAARDAVPIGWPGLSAPHVSVEAADNFFLVGQYQSLLLASLLALALSGGVAYVLSYLPLRRCRRKSKP